MTRLRAAGGELWVEAPGLALSSTVDGGLRRAKGAVFRRIRTRVTCGEMEAGAYPDYLNFYTAVDVERHHAVASGDWVDVVATAGLGNTINVLAVMRIEPDARALADAFRLAAEAKAVAACDLGIRRRGSRVGGDVSDAVAVVATGGAARRYVGLGTEVGEELFRLVREAVVKALGDLGVDWELRQNLGVSYGDLLDLAMELYSRAPVPGAGDVGEAVKKMLEAYLADPNVWAFIYAAGELDAKAAAGCHRGLTAEEHARDSKRVVVDEALGVALAQYINGFKAVEMMYWVDREKPGPLANLPMYADDVAAALLAGILSRLYDKLIYGV